MVFVDSSVLIHLSRINKLYLLKHFFSETGKIKITSEVYDEVKEGRGSSEILEACQSWIGMEELPSRQAAELSRLEREGIEKADASLLLVAIKEKDILLSNDYALIMVAKSRGIECWWLTTFLIRCLNKKVIAKKDAKKILFELVDSGMRLNSAVYATILKEIDDYAER